MRNWNLLLFALLFVAPLAAAQYSTESSDPSGDVARAEFSGSRGGSSWSYAEVGGHPDVDILEVGSHEANGVLILGMLVAGEIQQVADADGSYQNGNVQASGRAVLYQFSLDLRGDEEEEYRVTYDANGASLHWIEDGESQSKPVPGSHDAGRLSLAIPLSDLGTLEHLQYTAAAADTRSEFDGRTYEGEIFVDLVGSFPEQEYEGAYHINNDEGSTYVSTPGVGFFATLAGLGIAAFARRR